MSTSRRWLIVLLAGIMSISGAGCLQQWGAIAFLLSGKDPTLDPRVKLLNGRRDKKKMVILVSTSDSLRWGFDALDDELSQSLTTAIAVNESRFELTPERKVRAWRDVNANWMDYRPQEIGEHFDVDYVLLAEVVAFSLNETKNQYLLKGKTTVIIKIWDVNKDALIFEDTYQREYPTHRSVQLTDVSSEEQFRRSFLNNVAIELSWYIVPHRQRDEIGEF